MLQRTLRGCSCHVADHLGHQGAGSLQHSGLTLLALFVTAAHFVVVYGYTALARRILSERAELQLQYIPSKGAVEKVMQMCTGRGYVIHELAIPHAEASATQRRVIHFQVTGRRGVEALVVSLSDIKGSWAPASFGLSSRAAGCQAIGTVKV